MYNPFSDSSNDLLKLDSQHIADHAAIDTMSKLVKLAQDEYDIFVKVHHVSQTKSVQKPI